MAKRTGIVLMTLGAVLIISALLLFISNKTEDAQAGEQAQQALEGIYQIVQDLDTVPDETQPTELAVVTVDGYEYVGALSIPELELNLPVMADWDDQRLKIAPCRQFGSPQGNDLVIAGHNYVNHFAYLYKLESGDLVYFMDVSGSQREYAVDHIERLSPTDVDAVQNSGYDLVLYTCTYGKESRTAVFCSATSDK